MEQGANGLLIGRDPLNFSNRVFSPIDEANFFLTEKVFRQEGKRIDFSNLVRHSTNKYLLPKENT